MRSCQGTALEEGTAVLSATGETINASLRQLKKAMTSSSVYRVSRLE